MKIYSSLLILVCGAFLVPSVVSAAVPAELTSIEKELVDERVKRALLVRGSAVRTIKSLNAAAGTREALAALRGFQESVRLASEQDREVFLFHLTRLPENLSSHLLNELSLIADDPAHELSLNLNSQLVKILAEEAEILLPHFDDLSSYLEDALLYAVLEGPGNTEAQVIVYPTPVCRRLGGSFLTRANGDGFCVTSWRCQFAFAVGIEWDYSYMEPTPCTLTTSGEG